jgi:hypothetical protein
MIFEGNDLTYSIEGSLTYRDRVEQPNRELLYSELFFSFGIN